MHFFRISLYQYSPAYIGSSTPAEWWTQPPKAVHRRPRRLPVPAAAWTRTDEVATSRVLSLGVAEAAEAQLCSTRGLSKGH